MIDLREVEPVPAQRWDRFEGANRIDRCRSGHAKPRANLRPRAALVAAAGRGLSLADERRHPTGTDGVAECRAGRFAEKLGQGGIGPTLHEPPP